RDIEDVRTIMHLTRDVGVNLAGVEMIVGVRRRLTEISSEMGEMVDRMIREMEREMLIKAGLMEPEADADKKRESKVVKIKIEKG
ncbi:MAG: hypothetical protein AAB014_05270, partial [Nitrospirota bacterium]